MEVPSELWNLIMGYNKWNITLYKSCILVNKQLHYVIKILCDKIPNQVKMDLFLVDQLHSIALLNTNNHLINHVYDRQTQQTNIIEDDNNDNNMVINDPLTIHKLEKYIFGYSLKFIIQKNKLLTAKWILLQIKSNTYIKFPLLIDRILDESFNQTNNKIVLLVQPVFPHHDCITYSKK